MDILGYIIMVVAYAVLILFSTSMAKKVNTLIKENDSLKEKIKKLELLNKKEL